MTKELVFSKDSVRWVLRLSIPEQKFIRCTLPASHPELFEADEDNSLALLVSLRWTLVGFIITSLKSKNNHSSGSIHLLLPAPPPTSKTKVILSAGKVMASDLLRYPGVLSIDYL